ncbi:cytochrome P450 [Nemania sp. FL0031]|nr:cytochrome P450 [Nemania sp. FL0031]
MASFKSSLTMPSGLCIEDFKGFLSDHWAMLACVAVATYASLRYIHLSYFHPASRFPGPKLAAVSNLWYAYHCPTGRYPWAVEKALKKCSDAVRVAPNELVFITPQAASSTYPHATLKTTIVFGDDGIMWEKDPAKHRKLAKELSPAFNVKFLNALEPTMRKHIGSFVEKMKTIGVSEGGIELKKWTDWVAMDMAADLTSRRKLNQVQDTFNYFVTVNQVFQKFPLLSPLKWAFLPFSVLFSRGQIELANREALDARIESRAQAQSLEHFERILPASAPVPTEHEKIYLEVLVSHQFQCAIMFSLLEPQTLKVLMRLTASVATSQPRSSPGSEVDGNYITKGEPEFQDDATGIFFPFGHGPRACIGQAQVWRQIRLFVAKVLWEFDVEMLPGQDFNFERDFRLYAMWEKPKFWVRFHKHPSRENKKD